MPERPEEVRTDPARHSIRERFFEHRTVNIERPTSHDVIASLRRLLKTRVHWLPHVKDSMNTNNDRIPYSMLDVHRSTFMGMFFSLFRGGFIKPPALRVVGDSFVEVLLRMVA